MVKEENWKFKNVDGYTTFAVSDLEEENILIFIYSITQYLCLFDEEFHGDFNIEYVCIIEEPNQQPKVEFLTDLPYELFQMYN